MTQEAMRRLATASDSDLLQELRVALDGPLSLTVETDDAYRAALMLRSDIAGSLASILVTGRPCPAETSSDRPSLISELFDAHSPHGPSHTFFMLGCHHHPDKVVYRNLVDYLDGGAIVISSDRSARYPLLRDVLRPQPPAHPRRARVQLCHDSQSNPDEVQIFPAVRLSPGYLPLTSDVVRAHGVRVIARDALSGDPIAVAAPVLNGWVLHSSAHWWQDAAVDETEAGHRLLLSTPGYRDIGLRFPTVTVGAMHAALGMLLILEYGLRWIVEKRGS